MTSNSLKVMIVEDSKVVQQLLEEILTSDSSISVTSIVSSAEEAIEELKKNKPDLITIDFSLPKMDGLELTKYIMKESPIPIVVVSGVAESSTVQKSFELIQAGALATIKKPVGLEHREYQQIKNQLISTVKIMSEVKLVKRRDISELRKLKLPPRQNKEENKEEKKEKTSKSVKIIAIGASTGGPTAIQLILKKLPSDFPVPIVIAQHIAEGFVPGFVSWLNSTTGFKIKEASHGAKLNDSTAYVCPSGFQSEVSQNKSFVITNKEFVNGVRPSVSYLFNSIANSFGKYSIGVLLSGMGKDGAPELKKIKNEGGITIAQNKETSIVHGMPGEAIALGGTNHILSIEQIPDLLMDIVESN